MKGVPAAGQHRLGGPVDRRDVHEGAVGPQECRHGGLVGRHRGHAAVPWEPARSRLRRATRRRASSRPRTPAMQAATISPTPWPTTQAGSTPQDRHNWARA